MLIRKNSGDVFPKWVVRELALWAVAVLYGLYIVGIFEGGPMCIDNPIVHMQAKALSMGQLGVGYSLNCLGFDLCWYGGAVQQVWGLGVPLLLLVLAMLTPLVNVVEFPVHAVVAIMASVFTRAVYAMYARVYARDCRDAGGG